MATKLAAIKKACVINDAALAETLKNFSHFKTEGDVAQYLNKQIRLRGAKLAFPTIVANGPHAFSLHHKPLKTRLHRGWLLIDFGAKISGYCTDVTRTIFIGKPTKRETETYELIKAAQAKCVSAAKPSALGSDIDHLATLLLKDSAPNFIHSAGHGLDKKVHAAPRISSRSADRLKAGDIIAIELGVYIKKKFGIRIEDTVHVRKKPLALTKFPKRLKTLGLGS